jgi:hypothetical protein
LWPTRSGSGQARETGPSPLHDPIGKGLELRIHDLAERLQVIEEPIEARGVHAIESAGGRLQEGAGIHPVHGAQAR